MVIPPSAHVVLVLDPFPTLLRVEHVRRRVSGLLDRALQEKIEGLRSGRRRNPCNRKSIRHRAKHDDPELNTLTTVLVQ